MFYPFGQRVGHSMYNVKKTENTNKEKEREGGGGGGVEREGQHILKLDVVE